MAKPIVRIPLWGSGGTLSDPGVSKEATGWLVAERPPAFWWNWVLNAIGQWLSYFETTTDELITLSPQAFGSVTTDGVGGAAESTNTVGASAGISGDSIQITFDAAQGSADYAVTANYVGDGQDKYCVIHGKAAGSFLINVYDVSVGTQQDSSNNAQSVDFVVLGAG